MTIILVVHPINLIIPNIKINKFINKNNCKYIWEIQIKVFTSCFKPINKTVKPLNYFFVEDKKPFVKPVKPIKDVRIIALCDSINRTNGYRLKKDNGEGEEAIEDFDDWFPDGAV